MRIKNGTISDGTILDEPISKVMIRINRPLLRLFSHLKEALSFSSQLGVCGKLQCEYIFVV